MRAGLREFDTPVRYCPNSPNGFSEQSEGHCVSRLTVLHHAYTSRGMFPTSGRSCGSGNRLNETRGKAAGAEPCGCCVYALVRGMSRRSLRTEWHCLLFSEVCHAFSFSAFP